MTRTTDMFLRAETIPVSGHHFSGTRIYEPECIQKQLDAGRVSCLRLLPRRRFRHRRSPMMTRCLSRSSSLGVTACGSPAISQADYAQYSPRPYPEFGVLQPGYLTVHGQQAEILLGAYYRSYLLEEGLLTGDTGVDLARSYFRANSIQRSNPYRYEAGRWIVQWLNRAGALLPARPT